MRGGGGRGGRVGEGDGDGDGETAMETGRWRWRWRDGGRARSRGIQRPKGRQEEGQGRIADMEQGKRQPETGRYRQTRARRDTKGERDGLREDRNGGCGRHKVTGAGGDRERGGEGGAPRETERHGHR